MRIFKERKERFDIPNDPDGAWVEIKYLNEGQQNEIVAKGRKLSFTFIDGKEERAMVPDEIKLREESVDARITDWGNFYGDDDKELRCNRKNKILLSKEDGFMEMFQEFVQKLDDIVKEERGREEKNLPSSQGGSPE